MARQNNQKKSCCFIFFSRPKKAQNNQNNNTNQQNQNNLTTENPQPNHQQTEQEGPQIKINTNIDFENIKSVETKPTGLFSEIYPYSCPICLKYFNLILKHSCCGNYVCLFCLNLIEEQIKTKKLEKQCWWCRSSEFEIIDENIENKDIKIYSDQNELEKTNKDLKKIISNSKNFKLNNRDNLDARSVDDFIQTIKSANFYNPSNKNNNENSNNLNYNNSQEDFNEHSEQEQNQKFSQTAGETKIKKIKSSQEPSQKIQNRNFRTNVKKSSNLYLVDPQTGQYINENHNNLSESQQKQLKIQQQNQTEIQQIKRSSFYNETNNPQNSHNNQENLENLHKNLSQLPEIQQDQLENKPDSNESQSQSQNQNQSNFQSQSQIKSEEKIEEHQNSNQIQHQLQNKQNQQNQQQQQIKVDEQFENHLYELPNNNDV